MKKEILLLFLLNAPLITSMASQPYCAESVKCLNGSIKSCTLSQDSIFNEGYQGGYLSPTPETYKFYYMYAEPNQPIRCYYFYSVNTADLQASTYLAEFQQPLSNTQLYPDFTSKSWVAHNISATCQVKKSDNTFDPTACSLTTTPPF